jgi:hypothetical protein
MLPLPKYSRGCGLFSKMAVAPKSPAPAGTGEQPPSHMHVMGCCDENIHRYPPSAYSSSEIGPGILIQSRPIEAHIFFSVWLGHLLFGIFAYLDAFRSAIFSQPSKIVLPRVHITTIGNTKSNFPNIFRDGGGGGTVNGHHYMMFSDSMFTSGGLPRADGTNIVNFTSNTIACSNCDGRGVESLQDFGTDEGGPYQQIPFFYDNGETDMITGIWPNQNIATICQGSCGISFPQVVNRTAFSAGLDENLYNTAVEITLRGTKPVVRRPMQSIFKAGEPLFGTFGTFVGDNGYLYLLARTSKTISSNGLKLARVLQNFWADRTKYQYWDGTSFVNNIIELDDGGRANIFNFSHTAMNGVDYGPGTGDLFFSKFYGVYILLFQTDDAALDPHGR